MNWTTTMGKNGRVKPQDLDGLPLQKNKTYVEGNVGLPNGYACKNPQLVWRPTESKYQETLKGGESPPYMVIL